MTPDDYKKYVEFFEYNKENFSDVKEITMLSPNPEQDELIRNYFPNAKYYYLSKDNWDFGTAPLNRKVDIVFAANVFQYIKDPKSVINTLLPLTRFLIIQDLIVRKRGGEGIEFSPYDGDCMRFSYRQHKAEVDNAFDLSFFENNIIKFEMYHDETNQKISKHFIVLMSGDIVKKQHGKQDDISGVSEKIITHDSEVQVNKTVDVPVEEKLPEIKKIITKVSKDHPVVPVEEKPIVDESKKENKKEEQPASVLKNKKSIKKVILKKPQSKVVKSGKKEKKTQSKSAKK